MSPVADVPPGKLLLVTDFDGTLADIVADPAQAQARPEALQALRALAALVAGVIVLSSRKPEDLQRLVPVAGVRLVGDSGMAVPRHAQKAALESFTAEATRALQGVGGTWVEAKPASTAVHFRNSGLNSEQVGALLVPLVERTSLTMALGRKVFEIHARLAGKGSALAALVAAEDPGGVVCFGDDENDRSMFGYVSSLAIPHTSVGVWSAEAPAGLFDRCDIVVNGPSGAVAVLSEIVQWARGRPSA
jgi:trehalose 6-phosphate phosphatase